jgi:hypothetical protein
MHKRFLIATLAAALLLLGPAQGAFAHGGGYGDRYGRGYGGGGCQYDNRCSNGNGNRNGNGYGSSNDGSQKWWDCRSDPYRDNDQYQTPCRYYSECTNYPRCKD